MFNPNNRPNRRKTTRPVSFQRAPSNVPRVVSRPVQAIVSAKTAAFHGYPPYPPGTGGGVGGQRIGRRTLRAGVTALLVS